MAKFCSNCGKELDDNAVFCPQCGVSMETKTPSTVSKESNGMAIAGFILSFFFQLLGLIFSIIGLNKAKETGSGKGLSIAGIIISSIGMFVGLIIGLLVLITVPTTINAIDTAKQKAYCKTAYNCILQTDGTYNCKYTDSEGQTQNINCEAKYRY